MIKIPSYIAGRQNLSTVAPPPDVRPLTGRALSGLGGTIANIGAGILSRTQNIQAQAQAALLKAEGDRQFINAKNQMMTAMTAKTMELANDPDYVHHTENFSKAITEAQGKILPGVTDPRARNSYSEWFGRSMNAAVLQVFGNAKIKQAKSIEADVDNAVTQAVDNRNIDDLKEAIAIGVDAGVYEEGEGRKLLAERGHDLLVNAVGDMARMGMKKASAAEYPNDPSAMTPAAYDLAVQYIQEKGYHKEMKAVGVDPGSIEDLTEEEERWMLQDLQNEVNIWQKSRKDLRERRTDAGIAQYTLKLQDGKIPTFAEVRLWFGHDPPEMERVTKEILRDAEQRGKGQKTDSEITDPNRMSEILAHIYSDDPTYNFEFVRAELNNAQGQGEDGGISIKDYPGLMNLLIRVKGDKDAMTPTDKMLEAAEADLKKASSGARPKYTAIEAALVFAEVERIVRDKETSGTPVDPDQFTKVMQDVVRERDHRKAIERFQEAIPAPKPVPREDLPHLPRVKVEVAPQRTAAEKTAAEQRVSAERERLRTARGAAVVQKPRHRTATGPDGEKVAVETRVIDGEEQWGVMLASGAWMPMEQYIATSPKPKLMSNKQRLDRAIAGE